MSMQLDHNPHDGPDVLRQWGFWAVLIGGLALILVFVQLVGPSFQPQPSAATQIGEIAGEMKRAAWKSFLGLPQPEPEAPSFSIWPYVALAAPILGVAAIVLALVSRVLGENWRYGVYGTCFGIAAIVFHFFWWVALLVVGMVILVSIIENFGDIFSF